jgi:hypothetical protein
VFTIEVTFTPVQANSDIVDDILMLMVARERRSAIVLLLSLSTCDPWESAAATAMLSFDPSLKDLLSEIPLAIFSPSASAGLQLRAVHRSRQTRSQCKTHTFPANKTLPSYSSLIACRLFVDSAVREVHSLSSKVLLGKRNSVTRRQPSSVADSMEYGKKSVAIAVKTI